MGKITNVLQKLIGNLNVELDETRRKIANTKEQLEALAARPVDLPTVEWRIDYAIAKLQEEFFALNFKVMGVNSGEWQERDSFIDLREIDFSSPQTHAALYGDQLRAALLKAAHIDHARRPEGIAPSEREAQEKALRAELLKLEIMEEDYIDEAAKTGIQIPRRPDASPEAILGAKE